MSKALESFGKYLLLEKLAAGGMAEVFLAKSVGAGGIGKFVAMKRILPQFTDNQEFIDMFKEEAKLVMNLNHGNIVSIFDFGIEHNQFFLVMEFVEGQNLRQTINHLKKSNKGLSIDQAVYIIKEIAAGLDHAHRCVDASTGKLLNITHRDISPQNIMLSFEGEVKVVDFGIAKAETQLEQTRAGTIKGKFGYMSPEQAEGQIVDARTDIFSLGIVLWELLANDRLFTGQSEQATLKKIKDCQIPSIRKLNPAIHLDLEKILLKALDRDRTTRYQMMENFAKDLSKFLNTHYPEFSKQEFSKFMKSAYSEMYLDNRKKLSEFAKIEANSVNTSELVYDKTAGTQTHTKTEVEDDVSVNLENGSADKKILIEKGLITAESQKIDLSTLTIANKKSQIKGLGGTHPSAASHAARQNAGYAHSQTRTNVTHSGTSRSIHLTQKNSSSWFSKSISIMIIVGVGFWFWQNQNKKISRTDASLVTPTDNSQTAPVAKIEPTQQQGVQLQNDVPLFINSTPSEAKIYIDDIYVGETPYRSHIAPTRNFRVRLIKSGYITYDLFTEKANPDGYHKVVSMLPEAASGWVKVDAANIEPKSYVLINGRQIQQDLKEEIKVPAGAMITIKVVNPGVKLEGSETIIVGSGEHKRVKILINRAAQINP